MLLTGSPGREDDPNGVYTAAGSPVASFPSIYSETDQSSRASQTYSQGQTSLMRCAARLPSSAAWLSIHARETDPALLDTNLGACRWRRTVEEHLSGAGAEGTTFHILAKRMDPSRSRLAASRAFHDLLCTIHSLPCAERLSSKQAEVRERLWVLTVCGGWVCADMASHEQVQVQQKIAYGDIRMRLVSAAA